LDNRIAILDLLTAYLNKQVSHEEFNRLFSALAKLEDEDFTEIILQALDRESDITDADFIQERLSHLYSQLQGKILFSSPRPVIKIIETRKKRSQIWQRAIATAAAALVFLLISFYFIKDQPDRGNSTVVLTPERILPGSNRATLILADGRTVDLSADKNGIVVKDGIKYADGSTVVTQQPDKSAIVQARLSTPRGGQYKITLADGTDVWLNAASTLTYPIEFSGREREVTLEGEAYFEVTRDEARPFIVNTAKQRTEVLGTSFNINAYDNETLTKTTLLNGSVRVQASAANPAKGRILVPNQQSIIGNDENIRIYKVDPAKVVAWKEGIFNFHGLSIDESLKQIERWYDIDIIYQGVKPEGYLGGRMSRGVKLSTFLEFLEKDFHIQSELKEDRTLLLYTETTNH